MPTYNKVKAKDLILTAERSIRIIRGLMEGKTVQDIVALEEPKVRQLVYYYVKLLSKKN